MPGIALATAIFPLLSRKAAQNDHAGLARACESGIRASMFIALPASLGWLFHLAAEAEQARTEQEKD